MIKPFPKCPREQLSEERIKRGLVKRVYERSVEIYNGNSDTFANSAIGPSVPFSVKFALRPNPLKLLCSCDESGILKLHSAGKIHKISAHENTILDVEWIDGDTKIATVFKN